MIFVQALRSLRPGAEFTMNDEDLSTIVWYTEGVKTPTKKEVADEIKRLQTAEAKAIADKAAAKASAIAKLEALGLNLEEAQAIFG
jgi:hypothetical protein